MKWNEVISIIVAIMAIIISIIALAHERKSLIYNIITDRVKVVHDTWKNRNSYKGMSPISNSKYSDWSQLISEIIITTNLIKELSSDGCISKLFIRSKIFYTIFWEQLNTDIRTEFKDYVDDNAESNNKDLIKFRKQVLDIKKRFEEKL